MSFCDIWQLGPGSITWSFPEPRESLDTATGTAKSIVNLCPKCDGTTRGDPPVLFNRWGSWSQEVKVYVTNTPIHMCTYNAG